MLHLQTLISPLAIREPRSKEDHHLLAVTKQSNADAELAV
jgi:hypothetical protein